MANTLIVFELVPEETKFYIAPTSAIPKCLMRAFRCAHGTFGGSADTTEEQDDAHALIVLSTGKDPTEDEFRETGSHGWNEEECEEVASFLHKREVPVKSLPASAAFIECVFVVGWLL